MAKAKCEETYLVETVEELDLADFQASDVVGIMAGASTPKESIEAVEQVLRKI